LEFRNLPLLAEQYRSGPSESHPLRPESCLAHCAPDECKHVIEILNDSSALFDIISPSFKCLALETRYDNRLSAEDVIRCVEAMLATAMHLGQENPGKRREEEATTGLSEQRSDGDE
jgi:hypothetical protein